MQVASQLCNGVVNRRIGGLEKCQLGCLQVASVNRRIGGLENNQLTLCLALMVNRRIGGLEI